MIDAESGIIALSGGGRLGGTYQTAAGAAIEFQGGAFDLGVLPEITGDGLVQLVGGNLTIESEIDPRISLDGGNIILGANFQDHGVITNLTLNGAYLPGNNTVSGALTLDRRPARPAA